MRIEGPKIEVSNLEGAIQGSKIIQIIWFNLLWCILLGPQLSPVSSVLLLDIIFIDWLKVRTSGYQSGRSKSERSESGRSENEQFESERSFDKKIQSKKTSSMNPEFLRRLEVTRTFFLRYLSSSRIFWPKKFRKFRKYRSASFQKYLIFSVCFSRSVTWGASSRWSTSQYCPMCNSTDEMTIGKAHPSL